MELKKIAIFSLLSACILAVYGFLTGYAFSAFGGSEGGVVWYSLVFFIPFIISACIFAFLAYSVTSHHYQSAVSVLALSYLLSYVLIFVVTRTITVNILTLFDLVITLIALCIGTYIGKGTGFLKNA
jgi:hypothetical protein